MLVPKLFRWLFFRKKLVQNTFDALRNPTTVYLDTSLDLGHNQSSFPNAIQFDVSHIDSFKKEYNADAILVIFGNNPKRRNDAHDVLENNGYAQVYNVGTLDELIQIKNQLNEK